MTTRFWISWLFDFCFQQQCVLKKVTVKQGVLQDLSFAMADSGASGQNRGPAHRYTAKRCFFCDLIAEAF